MGNRVYNIPRWRLQGVWQCMHEALRRAVRRRAGRDPAPSAAIMDSQRGPKRHLLVDTPRLLLSVYIIPANNNLSDREGPRRLLIGLKPLQPSLERI